MYGAATLSARPASRSRVTVYSRWFALHPFEVRIDISAVSNSKRRCSLVSGTKFEIVPWFVLGHTQEDYSCKTTRDAVTRGGLQLYDNACGGVARSIGSLNEQRLGTDGAIGSDRAIGPAPTTVPARGRADRWGITPSPKRVPRLFVCLFVHGTGPRHRNDLVSGRLALASSRARSDLYWNGECLRSPPVGWCDVTPP